MSEDQKVSSMVAITGKTMVPISLVISLIGGSGWMTKVHSTVEKNTAQISEVKEKEEETLKVLREINTRLSRIEGRLEVEDTE